MGLGRDPFTTVVVVESSNSFSLQFIKRIFVVGQGKGAVIVWHSSMSSLILVFLMPYVRRQRDSRDSSMMSNLRRLLRDAKNLRVSMNLRNLQRSVMKPKACPPN